MLAEVDARPSAESPEPPRKRRRPGERRPVEQLPEKAAKREDSSDEEAGVQFEDVPMPTPTIQTLYRDSDDDEDEEGLEFEDVVFSSSHLHTDELEDKANVIQLDLSARADTTRRQLDRRKPMNKSEKERRVEIHKTHLLCLLSHVARRNRWCNDAVVQEHLRKLLTPKTLSYLNPGENLSQFGQTLSLKNGLNQVENSFKTKYEITERGLRRALWADSEEHLQNYRIPDDAESPMDISDFRNAAKTLRGSRDVGAQLYCALLRAAGVETRLVCSLQPLSFASGGPSMGSTPKSKQKLSIMEQYARIPTYDNSFDGPVSLSPTARRRLGHPNATAFEIPAISSSPSSSRQAPKIPKKIRESAYPVYWVEVLDVAHQKWQPADPLVTQSFWKPQVFEPPASERENCMSYVIGFEADGTVKDVTRRYAKAYNAKTRKLRIESVIGTGERWWRKALRASGRGYTTDLDQIENNELAAAEAREPMPRNIADFKDHPIYALERHLRRYEVLIPGATSSGTVGAGSKGPLERIYRRKDVRIARTRQKWYWLGREVPADEIPVKFVPKPAKKQTDRLDEEEEDETYTVGTPIFTLEQTHLYKAPPIVDGVIPKNRYGNLDVFVPSMIPEGGAYVVEEYGPQAAFTLGIDYAPALTGFQFRGRQGTALLHGVVVAVEHEEAVRAVIDGLKDKEADFERETRRREVLRAWKRLLMNLRVRQRIWVSVESDEDRQDKEVNSGQNADMLSDASEDEQTQQSLDSADDGGGFVIDDDEFGGGFC